MPFDNLFINSYLSLNRSSLFGVTPLLSRFSFGPFNGTDQPLLVYEVIIHGLELQFEGQYDINEDRIALVQKIDHRWNIKLLAGSHHYL
jgi:hypothetical protein